MINSDRVSRPATLFFASCFHSFPVSFSLHPAPVVVLTSLPNYLLSTCVCYLVQHNFSPFFSSISDSSFNPSMITCITSDAVARFSSNLKDVLLLWTLLTLKMFFLTIKKWILNKVITDRTNWIWICDHHCTFIRH